MAVTVGLLGELGYVGIDAVLVPTPPRRFGGGVREPVEIPRKLAEGVRGERNIVLQRVDMQLHNLGPSGVLSARTPYTKRVALQRDPRVDPGYGVADGVPSGPSPKPRVHLAHQALTTELCPLTLSGRTKSSRFLATGQLPIMGATARDRSFHDATSSRSSAVTT